MYECGRTYRHGSKRSISSSDLTLRSRRKVSRQTGKVGRNDKEDKTQGSPNDRWKSPSGSLFLVVRGQHPSIVLSAPGSTGHKSQDETVYGRHSGTRSIEWKSPESKKDLLRPDYHDQSVSITPRVQSLTYTSRTVSLFMYHYYHHYYNCFYCCICTICTTTTSSFSSSSSTVPPYFWEHSRQWLLEPSYASRETESSPTDCRYRLRRESSLKFQRGNTPCWGQVSYG